MNTKNKITFLPLPLILLVIGLYLVPIQIYELDFSKIPGDFGDARFNNYILEHGHKFLTGKISSYWDAPFMYPFPNVIAFSDNLLGTVPIYSVFRILGNDRETAFQLWLLTIFALNFICCYWALNKWFGNIALSATGAYIFAFSIFILGHIYNAQNFPRFIVPFVFYWTWKYLSQKEIKYLLFLALGIVYQFYCGIYLGFFLIYALLFLTLAHFIIYRNWTLFTQLKKIKTVGLHAIIFLSSALLLAPLLLPYIEISKKFGMREFQDAISSIPTFRSYFFTSKAPVIWNVLSEHGIKYLPAWWCHHMFMGALPWLGISTIPLVLLLKKINPEKKKFIAFVFFGLLLSFIFSLKINDFTLYEIIFKLPGFSSMRAINRVINIEVMFFIIIFVAVFNELSKYKRVFNYIVLCFPALIIIDNLIDPRNVTRYDKKESQNQIEDIKEKIKNRYDKKYNALAYMPPDIGDDPIRIHLNVMLASQDLNIPCVNAYSGSYPPDFNDFFSKADNEALSKWFGYTHYNKNLVLKMYSNTNQIDQKTITLKAINGKYVCADGTLNHIVIANRDIAQAWETFHLLLFKQNQCAILAYNSNYLCAELNQQSEITATRKEIGAWETFLLVKLPNNFVAFKSLANGKYLSFDTISLQLFAKSDSIGKQEKFELSVK